MPEHTRYRSDDSKHLWRVPFRLHSCSDQDRHLHGSETFQEISGENGIAITRSEEHTSELQSHRDLHSFPTRRSSDLWRVPFRLHSCSDQDRHLHGSETFQEISGENGIAIT